jgi:hypothetical protein
MPLALASAYPMGQDFRLRRGMAFPFLCANAVIDTMEFPATMSRPSPTRPGAAEPPRRRAREIRR